MCVCLKRPWAACWSLPCRLPVPRWPAAVHPATSAAGSAVRPQAWKMASSLDGETWQYPCCDIELTPNISMYVKVRQARLKLSVRDRFPTARSTAPLLIFTSFSSQGFSQASVKFILKGLPQNPASSWENNTRCCYAVAATHGAPWRDTMLCWAVTLKAAVSLMVPFNCQALQLSIFFYLPKTITLASYVLFILSWISNQRKRTYINIFSCIFKTTQLRVTGGLFWHYAFSSKADSTCALCWSGR